MKKTLKKRRTLSSFLIALLLVSSFSCSSSSKEVEPIIPPQKGEIESLNKEVEFNSFGGTHRVVIKTDLKVEDIEISIPLKDRYWLSAKFINDKSLEIKGELNNTTSSRNSILTLQSNSVRETIKVSQVGTQFVEDQKVRVKSVTATSHESNNDPKKNFPPENMLDGDPASFFNSKYGAITDWPFYIDFYFEGDKNIDYIKYFTRMDAGNGWGAFGEFEIWIATKDTPELVKFESLDYNEETRITRIIDLKGKGKKVTHIQFKVFSALKDRVSCGEMEFYNKVNSSDDYEHIFTDVTYSELKDGVTKDDIDEMENLLYREVALALFNKEYDGKFRVQTYRPYQHPNIRAKENKTNSYSLRDNATGIYIKDIREKLIVLVGESKASNLILNIFNFKTRKEESFPLITGENIITPTMEGLIYIYNHTDKYYPLNPDKRELKNMEEMSPKIHILTGGVNGYFDIRTDDESDWFKLLEKYATFDEIDVLGFHSHVVWRVSHYKKNNTDIVKMTNYIDRIVDTQKEFLGLYYYNRPFANRMFMHVDDTAPAAYATNYRTAYNPEGYSNVFTTEEGFLTRMWVMGHEVGHVNQVRPGMRWGGTTEVTNNIYAMYNQQQILGEAERLNKASDGYERAFKEIIKAKKPWVLPDNYTLYIPKLAPFWQLKLYLVDILKQKHFFHDLYEHYRTTPDLSASKLGKDYHGQLQLDFVRVVCNVSKMNMLEFFEEWGFLRPIDREVNDYGMKLIRITQKQIDELKREIEAKNYLKPEIKVQNLTDLNYRTYIK